MSIHGSNDGLFMKTMNAGVALTLGAIGLLLVLGWLGSLFSSQ